MIRIPKATKLNNNNNSTFVSPIHTFSLAGNIFVYTPFHGTNREKVLSSYYLQSKIADSGRKSAPLRPFFLPWTAFFSSFDQKMYVQSVRKDINVVVPAPTH